MNDLPARDAATGDLTASAGEIAEALEQSDGFQLLARALPDAILVVRAGGRVTYASVQTTDFFGRPADEIVGRPFLDLVLPDDRPAFPESFAASKLVGTWDFRSNPPTGEGRWLNAAFLAPGLTGLHGTALADALGDSALVLVRDLVTTTVRDRTDLLRRALDATNNLIVVTDPDAEDNPLVFVNEHFLDVTGYAREEIIGQNCRFLQRRADGTRDDDQDAVRELVRAVEAGEPAHVILRNYRKDGEMFYNELFVTPVRDRTGHVVNFVGVQNDVTDRILAEREALSQASLLRAFFDSAPVLMGVVQRDDAGLVHRTANDVAAELYECPTDEIPGARPSELGLTPREAARWERAVAECAEAGEPIEFETTFPWDSDAALDGVRVIRVVMSAVERQGTMDQGELYSYIGEDVTTTQRSERERKLLAAAVGAAAESILVTTAEVDTPGPQILYANEAHRRIFGYASDEVVGKTPRMFQGPETDRATLDRVRAALRAGEEVQAETTNYRKDGSEFTLQWEIAPVRDENGEITNWVGTQRDVTERRRLERDVLDAATREQERIAQDLHDGLGQVLTGASFRLEALRVALDRAGLADLAAEAGVARDLVGESVSQARALARGLFPVSGEVGGLVGALAALAADVSEAYGVEATFETDLDELGLAAEPASDLYRIAQEATANAARHGHAQCVAIALSHSADGVTLSVEDDGSGIPAAELDGPSRGLGLRSMRYRADRVGDGLQVSQREGGGTRVAVAFRLPDGGLDRPAGGS